MKNQDNMVEIAISNTGVMELNLYDQQKITGGGFAEDLGYAFGYPLGYFFAAGPDMIGDVLRFAPFLR